MGLFDDDEVAGLEDTDYVVDEEIDDDDEDLPIESDNHISAQPPLPSNSLATTQVVQKTFSKELPARLRNKGIISIVIKKKNGKEFTFT